MALEFPDVLQPAFDAILAAPDDQSALAILRETPLWTPDPDRHDGRSSVAMVELLQAIRRLKAAGHDVSLRAFMSSRPRLAGFDQNYHELSMAAGLADVARERPEARVLVLVGSFHAAKARYSANDFLPAAAHLPPDEVISILQLQQGGQSWSCKVEGCGLTDISLVDQSAGRGLILRSVDNGLFDGALGLGPVTASPPAPSMDQPSPISSGSSS